MEQLHPKRKYLSYIAVSALALAFIGVGTVSAHGLVRGFGAGAGSPFIPVMSGPNSNPEQMAEAQNNRFTQQAALLEISVDEVKQAWAEGKTLQDVATARGITAEQLKEQIEAARNETMKKHLDALVQQGVITQAQADLRQDFVQKQSDNMKMRTSKGKSFHFFEKSF